MSCPSILNFQLWSAQIQRLQKAFSTLFPNRAEIPSPSPRNDFNQESVKNEFPNRFEVLGDLVPDAMETLNIEDDEDKERNSTHTATDNQPPMSSEMLTLEDDPLIPLIRLHILLRVRLI